MDLDRAARARADHRSPEAGGTPLKVHAALALVQIFFAANAVYGKIALGAVSPLALLAVRGPSGALVFLGLRVFASRRHGWQRVARADLASLLALSVLGVSANQLLFYTGLSRTTAVNTVVLNASIPVFAAGFSIVLGRERATVGRLAGLGVALAGALLVVLYGRADRGPLRLVLGGGELFLVANSAMYALYLVLGRTIFQRYRTDTAIAWIFGLAALALLPWCLGPFAREVPMAAPRVHWAMIYIVLGPTVGAYFLNGFALRHARPSIVAIYIYAQPVLAALMARALLGEHLPAATVTGAALIAAGIALVSFSRGPTERRPDDEGSSPGDR